MADDPKTLKYVGQVVADKDGKIDLKSINEQLRLIWMALHKVVGKSGPVELLDETVIDGDLEVEGQIGANVSPTGMLHALIDPITFSDAVAEPLNVGNPWPSALILEAPNSFVHDPVGGSRIQVYPVMHMMTTNPTTGNRQKLLRFAAADNSWAITGIGKSGDGNDATLRSNYAGASTVWGLGSTIDSNFFLKVGGTVDATPIFGSWTKTSSTAGIGNFDWDTETYGNSSFFTRQNSNTELKVNIAGTYNIYFHSRTATAANGTFTLKNNGTTVASGRGQTIGDNPVCSAILTLAANDVITANLATAGDRFGDANFSTIMTIHRLN